MPLIEHSTYCAPFGVGGGHAATIWPVLFRRVCCPGVMRERIETPDGDFLDLERITSGHRQAVILLHGLEGSSRTAYMRGMMRLFGSSGWDVIAVNFRGCSGEPNRLLRSYHSGATEDLATVVHVALTRFRYDRLDLVGFSLGGNLMLKYLGDVAEGVDRRIRAAVGISVPCDLASSARRLSDRENRVYMRRFLQPLRDKIRLKSARFPGRLDIDGLDAIRDFQEFDDRFTAPIHGFKSADEYWRLCSCRPVLPRVSIPTLIINARNDPFLTGACFPIDEAAASKVLYLETPEAGGHVGFVARGFDGAYWSEVRALEFCRAAKS